MAMSSRGTDKQEGKLEGIGEFWFRSFKRGDVGLTGMDDLGAFVARDRGGWGGERPALNS
jgi:hypothetical protein